MCNFVNILGDKELKDLIQQLETEDENVVNH